MNFTRKEIFQIAEALVLQHTVFIHKKTKHIIALPFFPLGEHTEQIRQQYATIMADEKQYWCIRTPTENRFYSRLYLGFLLENDMPPKAEEALDKSYYSNRPEAFDRNAFFRVVEKERKMREWMAHEQSHYEEYVRQCLYPYEIKFYSMN